MGSEKLPKESRVKMISVARKNCKKEDGGIIRHIQVAVEVKRRKKGR